MKKANTIALCAVIAVITILIHLAMMEREPQVIPMSQGSDNWHDVLCIEEDGSADTYTIPVPLFEGFDDEFTAEYLEYAGQQFCDSIIDKTEYVHDVGEDN